MKLFAGQRREIAWVDAVVGRGPGVDLGRLVLEAEPRHQGERLEEGGDGVSLERPGGLGGVQAADRVEIVTPACSAWNRARFAIGTTPPRFRSMKNT